MRLKGTAMKGIEMKSKSNQLYDIARKIHSLCPGTDFAIVLSKIRSHFQYIRSPFVIEIAEELLDIVEDLETSQVRSLAGQLYQIIGTYDCSDDKVLDVLSALANGQQSSIDLLPYVPKPTVHVRRELFEMPQDQKIVSQFRVNGAEYIETQTNIYYLVD